MFKEILFAGLLSTGIGAGVTRVNPYIRNAFYDDGAYAIDLDDVETTYQYNNLADLYINEYDNQFDISEIISAIDNNSNTYSYSDEYAQDNELKYITFNYNSGENDYYIYFVLDYESFNYVEGFTLNRNNVFFSEDDLTYFTINSTNTMYDDLKNAIELDIQANTQPRNMPILLELVSLLVGGITGLAAGIGSGVNDLVADIFISNGSLSVIASVIVIFGAIALAIGLSRWVMRFLTTLGNKK